MTYTKPADREEFAPRSGKRVATQPFAAFGSDYGFLVPPKSPLISLTFGHAKRAQPKTDCTLLGAV